MTEHDELDRLTLGPIQNPVRALLHGTAALLAIAGTVALWHVAAGSGAVRWALAAFGGSAVALFLVSSLYHGGDWRPDAKKRLQRVDHSMIYVLIAGTYTPFAAVALEGWMRAAVLAGVWSITAVGVAQKAFFPAVRKRWSVALQLFQGWLIVPCLVPLAHHVPAPALALLVGGGIAYTFGALCYVSQRPRLWPAVFSYHEVFHVCVVLAASLHYTAALRYVALAG